MMIVIVIMCVSMWKRTWLEKGRLCIIIIIDACMCMSHEESCKHWWMVISRHFIWWVIVWAYCREMKIEMGWMIKRYIKLFLDWEEWGTVVDQQGPHHHHMAKSQPSAFIVCVCVGADCLRERTKTSIQWLIMRRRRKKRKRMPFLNKHALLLPLNWVKGAHQKVRGIQRSAVRCVVCLWNRPWVKSD